MGGHEARALGEVVQPFRDETTRLPGSR
jgi:hypothetical protein